MALTCLAIVFAATVGHATASKSPQAQIGFSVSRGYCEAPVALALTSPFKETDVRYTVDGSEPNVTNGIPYTAPLRITNTTAVRAAGFRQGIRVTAVSTHSYIFLDEVLQQPPNPSGAVSGARAWNGQPSRFEMALSVVKDPAYAARIKDAFRSLPVVSIVCRSEGMFGARGLYLNPLERGADWERACSAEMILTNGHSAFQADCGVRIQGNMNRVPEKSPKHSFRLLFKKEYGAGKLKHPVFEGSRVTEFDTLVLRADYNNSWVHWEPDQRIRGQRIRDAWMKDTARAMGCAAPHNRFVHLFLNGLYWGVYDFTERPDASFAAEHFGGGKADYDVVNENELKDGTSHAFDQLKSLKNLGRDENYQRVQRLLDVTNFIDYLLLNYYAGNQDWGEDKNWYALRRRAPTGQFQFIVWDGENVLNEADDDVVNQPAEIPLQLADELRKNPEFRRLFAARAKKHCFGDGALTPGACLRRWMKRAAEVDLAMIAESARWGDARRAGQPYTRDREWLAEQRRLVMLYFPQRTVHLLAQLKAASLFP